MKLVNNSSVCTILILRDDKDRSSALAYSIRTLCYVIMTGHHHKPHYGSWLSVRLSVRPVRLKQKKTKKTRIDVNVYQSRRNRRAHFQLKCQTLLGGRLHNMSPLDWHILVICRAGVQLILLMHMTTWLVDELTDAVCEGCGGFLDSPSGQLTSPNYPDAYPINRECIWRIRVEPGKRVNITIHDFDMEGHRNCSYDVLAVSNALHEIFIHIKLSLYDQLVYCWHFGSHWRGLLRNDCPRDVAATDSKLSTVN